MVKNSPANVGDTGLICGPIAGPESGLLSNTWK